MRRLPTAVVAGLVLLSAAGCDSSGSDLVAATPSRARATAPAFPTPDTMPTADPSSPWSPSAPSSPSITADDGTDLDACRDGTCRISVFGPVTLPIDGKPYVISVQSVTAGKVGFRVDEGPGAYVAGDLGVGCVAYIYPGGFMSACAGSTGPNFRDQGPGSYLRVLAAHDDTAILDLTST
ncbi:hypothetical protein [Embleya sp. AB8]|uniref:hypothetical protein n=1 Tax=Embleya sp. AB8 TaxID=3156304 RepID=UPI003C71DED6